MRSTEMQSFEESCQFANILVEPRRLFREPDATVFELDRLASQPHELVGIFNRSYYEDVLVVRVPPELLRREGVPEELRDENTIWYGRYRSIVDLERHLHRNGTRIVKIFLHLSEKEQRKRFLARIDEPDRNWKFSLADIRERKSWDQYMQAYEECLRATSTPPRTLVSRSRGQQRECPADRFPNRSRYSRRSENGVAQSEPKTAREIAVYPETSGSLEIRSRCHSRNGSAAIEGDRSMCTPPSRCQASMRRPGANA